MFAETNSFSFLLLKAKSVNLKIRLPHIAVRIRNSIRKGPITVPIICGTISYQSNKIWELEGTLPSLVFLIITSELLFTISMPPKLDLESNLHSEMFGLIFIHTWTLLFTERKYQWLWKERPWFWLVLSYESDLKRCFLLLCKLSIISLYKYLLVPPLPSDCELITFVDKLL